MVLFFLGLALPGILKGQTDAILASFGAGSATNAGANPFVNLVQGPDGNFYGTTPNGGTAGNGAVYKITPAGAVTVIHSFGDGSVTYDGINPYAGLILGSDGNFYGTTDTGGFSNIGTVFKITPAGAVTIVYEFGDARIGNDGVNADSALVQGSDGNFYGTTTSGGTANFGTVFSVTPTGDITILHSFGDGTVPRDGLNPDTELIQASDGNFYGLTETGGSASEGVVYKMTPGGVVTILHNFADGSVVNDGQNPVGALVQGSNGDLYGSTLVGGSANMGAVFEITTTGIVTILHSFGDGKVTNDGTFPVGNLVSGSDGNFYGTTNTGGSAGKGVAYKINTIGGVTILHHFGDGTVASDGLNPDVGMIQGTDGSFYGTTFRGGSASEGAIFKLIGPPVIFGSTQASGYTGGTFTYQIQSTPPATSFAATNLPSWLTLNTTTGLLSGVPPATGGARLTLTATSSHGTSSNFTLSISIGSLPTGAPQITSILSIFGENFNYEITATNSPTSFSVDPSTPLPSGLSLDPVHGFISGPETDNGLFGTFSVSIIATNAVGSDTETLTIDGTGQFVFTPLLTTPTNPAGSKSKAVTSTTTGDGMVQFNAVHNFSDGSVEDDGMFPNNILQAADGTKYVTTTGGGNSGTGTVLNQIETQTNPLGPKPRLIDSLLASSGIKPVGLTQGTDGNFYGVAASGGSQNQGTVFKITSAGILTVLHNFGDGGAVNDGAKPAAGLLEGTDGNFYGTTEAGGSTGQGTIFVVTPTGTVTVLHSFGDGTVANDGARPMGTLFFFPNGGFYHASNGSYYSDGTFFGTTYFGGSNNTGTVFTMTTQSTVKIVHSFGDPTVSHDGAYPMTGLTELPLLTPSAYIIPNSGSLYGTTYGGGTSPGIAGNGTVYSIATSGTASSYAVTHVFGDGSVAGDGAHPEAPMGVYSYALGYNQVVGPELMGTTTFGGLTVAGGPAGEGTVFILQPGKSPSLTIVHTFGDGTVSNDGAYPVSNLVEDVNGTIYGTTALGGLTGAGMIYSIGFTESIFTYNESSQTTYALAPNTGGSIFTTLPAGMSISSATGAPLGTPFPTDALGIYTYMIQPNPGTHPITEPPIIMGTFSTITTTSLPSGKVGTSYSVALQATNPTDDTLSYTVTGLPPGMSYLSTGQITGTPTVAGNYLVGLSATNSLGAGPVTTLPLTVSSTTQALMQSFTQWENNYAIASDTNPTAMPENDGLANLLKYLFDIDPDLPVSATDRTALPTAGIDTTTHPGTRYLTLTYREYAEATGLTLNVQTSTDLKTWATVTPDITTQIGTGTGDLDEGDPVMKVEVNTNGATHEFIRLNVTSP